MTLMRSICVVACLSVSSLSFVPPWGMLQVEAARQGSVTNFRFDVVSIRQSGPRTGSEFSVSSEGFVSRGIPLGRVLSLGFFPLSYPYREMLDGVPDWVWTDRYDVIAKVAPEHLSQWRAAQEASSGVDLNELLASATRQVLVERCALSYEFEEGDVKGFALYVRDSTRAKQQLHPVPAEDASKPFLGAATVSNPRMPFKAQHISTLAAVLTAQSKQIVIDETKLGGRFSFDLPLRIHDSTDEQDPLSKYDLAQLGLGLRRTHVPIRKVRVQAISPPTSNDE